VPLNLPRKAENEEEAPIAITLRIGEYADCTFVGESAYDVYGNYVTSCYLAVSHGNRSNRKESVYNGCCYCRTSEVVSPGLSSVQAH